jgi:hypothetical protein
MRRETGGWSLNSGRLTAMKRPQAHCCHLAPWLSKRHLYISSFLMNYARIQESKSICITNFTENNHGCESRFALWLRNFTSSMEIEYSLSLVDSFTGSEEFSPNFQNLFMLHNSNINLPSMLRSLKWPCPSVFRLKSCNLTFISSTGCDYMPRPPHPSWFYFLNNISWRVNEEKIVYIYVTSPADRGRLLYGIFQDAVNYNECVEFNAKV